MPHISLFILLSHEIYDPFKPSIPQHFHGKRIYQHGLKCFSNTIGVFPISHGFNPQKKTNRTSGRRGTCLRQGVVVHSDAVGQRRRRRAPPHASALELEGTVVLGDEAMFPINKEVV